MHTAPRRALQRGHHVQPAGIGQPDVEGDVDAVLRGVEITHHASNGCGRVGSQFSCVAGHRRAAGQLLADVEHGAELRRQLLAGSGCIGHVRDQLRGGVVGEAARAKRDPGLAKEQVREDSQRRDENQHDDPGCARRRLLAFNRKNPYHHTDVQQ